MFLPVNRCATSRWTPPCCVFQWFWNWVRSPPASVEEYGSFGVLRTMIVVISWVRPISLSYWTSIALMTVLMRFSVAVTLP